MPAPNKGLFSDPELAQQLLQLHAQLPQRHPGIAGLTRRIGGLLRVQLDTVTRCGRALAYLRRLVMELGS